jgi:glycosyltransferase involved in cell wall biosynthesis
MNTQTGAGFTVIIAAYNESAVIAKTIARAHQVWPDAQIIVVDDGSTDDTCAAVKNINVPYLRLHSYQPNRGKGFAIARGIELVETPCSLQLDADCQFPPEAMPALAAPLADGQSHLVFCSRYCAGGSIESGSVSGAKRLASKTASRLVSLLTGQTLTDVFAGFKAWDTAFARGLALSEPGFGYEAELAIKAAGKGETITEIPITYAARLGGESKIRFSRDLITVPLSIIRVWLEVKFR